MLHVQHQEAEGDDGGSSTSGDNLRPLNTVIINEIPGASLASNQVTLPPGRYFAEAGGTLNTCDFSYTFLYDDTGAATLFRGPSAYDNGETVRVASGQFTLAVESDVELHHQVQFATADFGLGFHTDLGGVEVYGDLKIWKLR